MASLFTHLAVAKRYIEKNGGIENVQDFYNGNVAPDIFKDTENTHYGKRGESKDLIKRHLEKIGLKEFLAENPLDNDFNRGKYLHLLVDWEFYNNLLPKDYVSDISDLKVFRVDLIYTSNFYHDYLARKYDVSYGLVSVEGLREMLDKWASQDFEKYGQSGPQGKLQFTAKQLDDFIEHMAEANLGENPRG